MERKDEWPGVETGRQTGTWCRLFGLRQNEEQMQCLLFLMGVLVAFLGCQANPVAHPYLAPTSFVQADSSITTVHSVQYPSGLSYALQGSPDTLLVYKENVDIKYTLSVGEEALPGEYDIHGVVTYQTCDHRSCFPPK